MVGPQERKLELSLAVTEGSQFTRLVVENKNIGSGDPELVEPEPPKEPKSESSVFVSEKKCSSRQIVVEQPYARARTNDNLQQQFDSVSVKRKSTGPGKVDSPIKFNST